MTGERPQAVAPAVPECHDEVCITCSDQAVAVTVVRLLDHDLAIVETDAGQEEVERRPGHGRDRRHDPGARGRGDRGAGR